MEHTGNCKELFALLSEYLDGSLAPQTCEEIREHLAGCPPCIQFLNSLDRTVKLCHECAPAEKPAPLAPEIRNKLLEAYRASLRK